MKLQTLVELIDETDTRSNTTSGADFLDEVKRQINTLRKDLGLPVEADPIEMAMMISEDVMIRSKDIFLEQHEALNNLNDNSNSICYT